MKINLTLFFLLTSIINRGQTVSDVDGNIYNKITIGTQTWTKENLRTTRYSNGVPIQYIASDTIWGGLTTAAYCTYNNDTSLRYEYGNLYNFYAVIDSQNICPIGWHVPSYNEWNILITYLGGSAIAGGKMKEVGLTHWYYENIGASNTSGLTVIPAGFRYSNNGFNPGSFGGLNGNGAIMTSTRSSNSTSVAFYFYPGDASVDFINPFNSYGISVRCISNESESKNKFDSSVFPNPAGDLLTVSIDGQKIIIISNLQGQIVKTIRTTSNTISISDLSIGSYVVSIFNIDYKLLAKNIITHVK